MSEPDLKPLTGARDVGAPTANVETERVIKNLTARQPSQAHAIGRRGRDRLHPSAFTQHPIAQGEAYTICDQYVGLARYSLLFIEALPLWWDKLRVAQSPEEKLTCERMINAINRADGLNRHERGARIAAKNIERRDAEDAAASAAEAAAAEAAAIDRWR